MRQGSYVGLIKPTWGERFPMCRLLHAALTWLTGRQSRTLALQNECFFIRGPVTSACSLADDQESAAIAQPEPESPQRCIIDEIVWQKAGPVARTGDFGDRPISGCASAARGLHVMVRVGRGGGSTGQYGAVQSGCKRKTLLQATDNVRQDCTITCWLTTGQDCRRWLYLVSQRTFCHSHCHFTQ